MMCRSWGLPLDVISFNAAISAGEKGGQWQRVAPSFDEVRRLRVAWRDQLQCNHLSVGEVWAVAV
eukprot:4155387-Karenia_brevis.AAC.1